MKKVSLQKTHKNQRANLSNFAFLLIIQLDIDVAVKTNQSGSIKYFLIKYSFEFIVIILGILISLLLEQNRQNSIEIDRKNNTIKQLINVIEEDINQIDGFLYLQTYSLISANKVLSNLNNNEVMNEDSIVFHLSSVGRALRSFFLQQAHPL